MLIRQSSVRMGGIHNFSVCFTGSKDRAREWKEKEKALSKPEIDALVLPANGNDAVGVLRRMSASS